MASDIKLEEHTVVVEGNLAAGTNNPFRKLHVEGSEIHSGGPGSGFSFSDRTKGNGERWVLYAQDGKARLWSQQAGSDVITVTRYDASQPWSTEIEGKLFVNDNLYVTGKLLGTLRAGVEKLLGREIGTEKIIAIQCEANAIQLAPNVSDSNPRFALHHDLHGGEGRDALVINKAGAYKQGVRIESNVQVTGTLTQGSSIAIKENVSELSGAEALATLHGLNAVKYSYKADEKGEQHLGFIAEDVPELVASPERDRLSPMDIVAVLTKAVQEQQKTIVALSEEVRGLRQNEGKPS